MIETPSAFTRDGLLTPSSKRVTSPSDIGFAAVKTSEGEILAWRKTLLQRDFEFRILRTLAEMAPVEELQRTVMGLSELDLVGASALIGLHETGGEILGAFIPGEDGTVAAGVLVGWGGYRNGVPRIVSDFLAVTPEFRKLGIGVELKKLQAAIALQRGFSEIIWTVDPLRAGNARLNFEKLGAHSGRYEIDRYRASFGTPLYGGMPTDRLHLTLSLHDERVHHRLHGQIVERDADSVRAIQLFNSESPRTGPALVHIPADIDQLLKRDPEAALQWRMLTRRSLMSAFEAGLRVTGFVAAELLGSENPALLLESAESNG